MRRNLSVVGRLCVVSCVALITGLAAISCGTGKKVSAEAEEAKVPCEAYLFDAKINRKGKQTSFRLEIYQTDSVLGLNGRAYLGKGALRGTLTADTLAIYLPNSKEYVYEPIGAVLTATECSLDSVRLDITQYFHTLPDSIPHDPRIKIGADRGDPKYPVYTIFVENCPWQMELVYDRQDTGWRILKFGFSNGKDLTLAATRREYRASTSVKAERLRFSYPEQAERIAL